MLAIINTQLQLAPKVDKVKEQHATTNVAKRNSNRSCKQQQQSQVKEQHEL